MSESIPESGGLLQAMVRNRKGVATVALLVALGLAALTLWAGRQYPDATLPILVWGLGATFGVLTFGLLHLFMEMDDSQLSVERIIVLSAGGVIGLATTLGGLLFAWHWRTDLVSWMAPGGEHPNGWGVLLALTALIGGVAIMFFSLRLAQAEERQRPVLRRLFHGYNAVLTGLLLLLNLLIFNTAVGAWTQKPEDFTANRVHSLSATSENILKRIEKPVQVVVILNPGTGQGGLDLFEEMQQLLRNCRQHTDKIKSRFIIPADPQEQFELINLASKVPALLQVGPDGEAEPKEGVLVIFGEGEQQDTRFIPLNELATFQGGGGPRGQRGPQQALFRGEEALMIELSFLTEEQKKTTIYFTQGNGELNIEDGRSPQGCGALKRRLEKRNFAVKPLTFSPAEAAVPADADLVVIAGPRDPLPDFAVRALEEYFGKRQGKLLVLVDLVPDLEGRPRPTGLEEFLAMNGLRLRNDRVIAVSQMPFFVQAGMNPNARCQLAAALKPARFIFPLPRPVEPLPPRMPGAAKASESLVINQGPVITDANLRTDPRQVIQELAGGNQVELRKRVSPQPISLAVAVGDSAGGFNPHGGPPVGNVDDKPRMVVFGSAGMISNRFIQEIDIPVNNIDLFINSVDWLRERKGGISGIGPKVHSLYTVNPAVGIVKLFVLPFLLVLIGLLGLGAGVWLVRRR